MKIFINPGHGGNDPGACSITGTKEKDIAANIAQILVERLKLNYYPVVCYQQKQTYFEISKQENVSGATCFISIHCNSSINRNAHGTEVLFQAASVKGKQIAEIMQNEIVKATGLYNRGIKPRTDIHVLNRTKAPAILIETAFLSNEKEEKLLKEQPEVFANAIWEGIKILKAKGLI